MQKPDVAISSYLTLRSRLPVLQGSADILKTEWVRKVLCRRKQGPRAGTIENGGFVRRQQSLQTDRMPRSFRIQSSRSCFECCKHHRA